MDVPDSDIDNLNQEAVKITTYKLWSHKKARYVKPGDKVNLLID